MTIMRGRTMLRLIPVLSAGFAAVLSVAVREGQAQKPGDPRPEARRQESRQVERPRQRPGDGRREGSLEVGDPAVEFELKALDGEDSVKLSGFRGKQPVVLIFGSYT